MPLVVTSAFMPTRSRLGNDPGQDRMDIVGVGAVVGVDWELTDITVSVGDDTIVIIWLAACVCAAGPFR